MRKYNNNYHLLIISGVYSLVKIRVYELAKELKMTSKELIEKMEELDLTVSSHMSTLESDEAKMIRELMSQEGKKETEMKNTSKGNNERTNNMMDQEEIVEESDNDLEESILEIEEGL